MYQLLNIDNFYFEENENVSLMYLSIRIKIETDLEQEYINIYLII